MTAPRIHRHDPPSPSISQPAAAKFRSQLGLATALVLAIASCGDGPPEVPESGPGAGEAADGSVPYRAPCEARGFPCTWGEIAPEALRLTDELGWVAVDIVEETGSLREAADFLRNGPNVAEVWVGDFAVQFRVEGGRPAWVSLPSDPENPRLSGIAPGAPLRPASSPVGIRPRAASLHSISAAARPTGTAGLVGSDGASLLQESGDKTGVAAPHGTPGLPKRALFLAPVAWHIGGLGRQMGDFDVRDYDADNDGEITYLANYRRDQPNPDKNDLDHELTDNEKYLENNRFATGEVTLEAFKDWDEYNFIYLLTHGKRKCDDSECYTVLTAGQLLGASREVAERYDALPGVEIDYIHSDLNRDALSEPAIEACKAFLDGRETPVADVFRDEGGNLMHGVPGPGLEPTPCFTEEKLKSAMLLVTTAFFAKEYSDGLENAVVFLAACQSLMAWDLPKVLTGQWLNDNIAILGFDQISDSGWAAIVGSELIRLMAKKGLHHRTTVEKLKEKFPESNISGVVLATDVGPEDLQPATVVGEGSNRTHVRDVVELVDPLTGEELADGAGVIALGSPGDGASDRIRVGMHVRGIDEETDVDAIRVYLSVDGRESEPYELSETVEPYVMRVGEEEIDLGFDLSEKETVDLEIRAELEGGGESRWSYEDLRLASWTLSVVSPSHAGRYTGFQGFFRDGSELGQLSLCSSEGPHIAIEAGLDGFSGPGDYVLGNGPDAQEGEVVVGPLNWRGVPRAQMREAAAAMRDWMTGNGESVLHQPDGSTFRLPDPSILRITRVTDDHVEGSLTGTFFRQTRSGVFERAEVSFSFATRRHDPVGSLFSMATRSEEMACIQLPEIPR